MHFGKKKFDYEKTTHFIFYLNSHSNCFKEKIEIKILIIATIFLFTASTKIRLSIKNLLHEMLVLSACADKKRAVTQLFYKKIS